MKQKRYNNPQWLTKTSEKYWDDREKMKWNSFFKECIGPMLKELELFEDENALALAKNLWHSAKEDEEGIRQELKAYKEYQKLQIDVQKMCFAGIYG